MNDQTDIKNDFGKSIKEVSILGLFAGNNLVIPEIQREYVWGHEKIGSRVLHPFFNDFVKSVEEFATYRQDFTKKSIMLKNTITKALEEMECDSVKDERLSAFSDGVALDMLFGKGIHLDSRVGFVYAYIPGFAKDGSHRTQPLLAYLIDGQQRVTTYFLMWLYLAQKAGKMEDFKTAIRYDKPSRAFDFKVRPLTHEFVNQLVEKVVNSESFDFSAINDEVWFLADYHHDVSVMSMVNALKEWDRVWNACGQIPSIAYEYLTEHVKFWLFVMTEVAQGEQLYITMNGRGKNLSEDEIIRAKVFRDAVKDNKHNATEVGKLFEDMTDFFWTHPIKDELNTDKGMKKFFRWVRLLERYTNEFPNEKREHERRQDQNNRSKFAAALQNDHDGDAKGFELDETMFGQDENTKETRISFDLILSSFRSLEELYRGDSPAMPYLRPTILEEEDSGKSFQQDCFVILPLLHWLNEVKKAGQLTDSTKLGQLGQLARYLRKMLSKNDVQRRVGEVVPVALRFAETFAKFQNGDLWEFLQKGGKINPEDDGYRLEVLPEEELQKAKCLVAVRGRDQELFMQFVELLAKIEDYKSKTNEWFSADYQIAAFLDAIPKWQDVNWDKDLYHKYDNAFSKFKRFWDRPNTLRKFRLLLEVGGYYETKWKLFPHSLVGVMSDRKAINHILAFEEAVDKLMKERVFEEGEAVDRAFDQYDKEFLIKYWEKRNELTDSRILCALALIVHCLSCIGTDGQWTKVQFDTQYRNPEIIENPEEIHRRPIGQYFFWFLSGTNWNSNVAIDKNLLDYHKKTADEADKLVQAFLENPHCMTEIIHCRRILETLTQRPACFGFSLRYYSADGKRMPIGTLHEPATDWFVWHWVSVFMEKGRYAIELRIDRQCQQYEIGIARLTVGDEETLDDRTIERISKFDSKSWTRPKDDQCWHFVHKGIVPAEKADDEVVEDFASQLDALQQAVP